jgi:membrane protein DedA with SNARE-associated domain
MVTFLGAGIFGVPPYRFALAEAAGTAVFVPAMTTLGFLFSDRAEQLVRDVGRVQHWLVPLGLVALFGYLALRAWSRREGLGGERPGTGP